MPGTVLEVIGNFCVVQNPVTHVLTDVTPILHPCSVHLLYLSAMLEALCLINRVWPFVFLEIEVYEGWKVENAKGTQALFSILNLRVFARNKKLRLCL